ncbi:uncharacterized protein [Dysidea avara]|uniref:uncharacterized protein isoform X4 n=1 Tax=Dysidea avara TaxID=196820 RepID=UPI003320773B
MQSSVKFTSSLVSCSPMDYGSPAVNLMLNQFAAFSLLRRRYFVLYQSIIPNCQRCLAILRDQCDIPDYMEDHILAGSCKRACSQRLFNFLLVKFEKDRDYQEFCDLIKMLMDFVFLRKNVDTLREKFATSAYLSQGRISLWCPPQEVINIEECVGDFDAAIAAQAAGFMPHEVLKMVQLDCTSLKACTSPHYEEHQRRRNKAVLPAVSKLTEQEEVNPPFQLPIERIPSEDHTVPVAFEVCKSPSMESILDEFPPLKVLYSVLVQSLPVNYTESVGHLEQYLTANAIFTIVSSPDADQGNQQIINSLLKQLTCIEDLLELCNRLEKIPNAPALSHAIEDLRKETITYIHLENKEASLGAQMISRNDLSGGNFGGPPLDEAIFEVAEALQPNTIGSEVLKKYYHQLYRSFSRDHMDTLGKLMQLGNVSSEKIDWISSAPNSTTGNQRILDYLLLAMDGENSMLELCDLLEKLIEHPVLLKVVESLRNDLLEVIENTKRSNSPEVSLTLPSDLAELMKNPMDSSGVEQLLARVVSSASTVNKGISPPSIHSYTPSATIEEIIEPEEAKPDDELKSDGDDSIPVGEAMSDTNSAVTTADSSKQPEESISDVRVPYQSPSPPISEHTPVPVSSPVPVITLDAVSAASSTVDVTSSLSVSTDPPISDQPTSSAVSQDESEDTVVDSTMEELLLKPLEMAMQGVPGFHVVKRHYGNLCSCFPSNYKKTVQKLQRLIDLDQEDMVLIISPTGDHPSDPVAVNQRVLMHLFLYCQSDEDLLKICSYLEELVDPTKRLSVDEFRRDLIAFLKKDKEEMEKQKEDDKELNRVMSHTGSVDAGEQPIDLTSDTTTTATTTTTTAAAMGSAIPSEPSVVQGATAAAANITQPSGGEQISYGDSELVKELLTNNEEFVVLNSNYVNLLRSFPEDYASCLNAVIEYITDEQTVLILDSPTPLVANQRILNCLIKQIKSKVEIVTFCDYLDKIENAKLSQAVEKLRNDVLQELHPPVTTTPTAKTIPHSSTDDEAAAAPEITVEHPTPPITDDEREVMELFKASQLDPKYTAVLKNYHAKLVECFPDKLSAIVEAISTQLPSVPDDFIQEIKTTSDASTANKLLLNFLILQLNTSQDVVDLCDTLETLVAGDDAVEVVEALRNDVLVVLLSSDPEEEAEVPISIDRLSSMLNTIDDSPDSSLATPDETNEPAGLVLEPLTDDKPPAETDVPYLDLPMRNKLPLHVATSASNKLPATQAAAPPTEEYLVPPPEKDTEEASTNIFKKYAAVMQNCIHPKRVAEKFDEHKLFSQGTNPISAHSELPNHVQMNYMLESIRTNMAINGAKVLYGLIRSFQSVPDYAELAAYFQADYNQAFGTSEIASKKPLGLL